MLTFVLVVNILLSLLGFYLAWKIWQVSRTLSNVADSIARAEQSTNQGLRQSPTAIAVAEQGTGRLREKYRQLNLQIQQLQKILSVLKTIRGFWQRRSRSRRYSQKYW
jgi:cell division protein FtsB